MYVQYYVVQLHIDLIIYRYLFQITNTKNNLQAQNHRTSNPRSSNPRRTSNLRRKSKPRTQKPRTSNPRTFAGNTMFQCSMFSFINTQYKYKLESLCKKICNKTKKKLALSLRFHFLDFFGEILGLEDVLHISTG